MPDVALVVAAESASRIYHSGKNRTVEALHDISLSIQRDDFVVVSGPSGSGKTTLLNLLSSIDLPTSGRITLFGRDTTHCSDNDLSQLRATKVGFVFQNFNLIPVLSAYENVEYPLRLHRVARTEAARRVEELLEAVELQDCSEARPSELSYGQQQRVAVARALAMRPGLILADEPTANLDSGTSTTIVELMKRMQERFGTTFVISTHDSGLTSHASRHFHLRDGRLADEPGRTHA